MKHIYDSPVINDAARHTGKLSLSFLQKSAQQIPIEQNRCAMACHGCGAVLLY